MVKSGSVFRRAQAVAPEPAVRYRPGPTAAEAAAAAGLPAEAVVKLSSNENPLGPSAAALAALREAAADVHRYPRSRPQDLVEAIGRYVGHPPERIVLGAGSSEVMGLAVRAFTQPGDEVVVPSPCFTLYEELAIAAGCLVRRVEQPPPYSPDFHPLARAIGARTRLLFLPRPNNPTSVLAPLGLVDQLARACPDVLFLVDEAYIEFAAEFPDVSAVELVGPVANLLVTRTFSKAFGLAGLRLGYGVVAEEGAELLERLRPKWNVSGPAAAAGAAALADSEHLARTRRLTGEGREQLARGLAGVPGFSLPVADPQGNFVLVDVAASGNDAAAWAAALARRGVLVRGDFSRGQLRVSVGSPYENTRFLDVLRELVGS